MEWSFLFFFNSALLGVGLAMDAFSVSMANGLHDPQMSRRRGVQIAGTFAIFQPVCGIKAALRNKRPIAETAGTGFARLSPLFW